MNRFLQLVREHKEELAKALTTEHGKVFPGGAALSRFPSGSFGSRNVNRVRAVHDASSLAVSRNGTALALPTCLPSGRWPTVVFHCYRGV